jgi:phosphatidylglycerol:prolipoprotein diacylglycerol transferase
MKYTTISFPSLGIEINPPSSFDIGNYSIHFYGILIALGLVLAVIYGLRRREQFGLSEDDIMDGVLCIVPFAIICARLYYCAFSWDTYAANPISILYIWEGGLAIYGGVIGAAIGIIVFSRIKKLSLGALLDLVSIGFLIGQSIGRWGNFMNREAFGAVTDSFLRMGLLNPRTGVVTYYHPTFLYESLWNAAGFVLLHFLSKKRRYDGQIALGYVAWYGLGRAFIEGLRMDSLYWGEFRVSQMLAAITCFAAVGALMFFHFFRQPDPDNMQVRLFEAQQEAQKEEKKNG